MREVRLSFCIRHVWHVCSPVCLSSIFALLCSDIFRFREMSRPEMVSYRERIAPDGGHSRARVMLDHRGGLVHLLWLGKEGSTKIFNQSWDISTKISPRSPTFGWLVQVIWGEEDLDLLDSFLLCLLPWWASLVCSSALWQIWLLACCWPPGLPPGALLKASILWSWFGELLRLHVNSTENSSPEGDSINAARPSSDLTMISPLGPNSALEEDHSAHCTCESMLKKGCRREC